MARKKVPNSPRKQIEKIVKFIEAKNSLDLRESAKFQFMLFDLVDLAKNEVQIDPRPTLSAPSIIDEPEAQ